MSGKLLLFGFEALPAILAVEAAVGPLGVEVVPVGRADYNKPLEVLAGLDTAPGTAVPFAGQTLGGRMLVLCGMDGRMDALLSALRQAGVGPDCLKAVLTPHNRKWNPLMLYAELQREHQALRGGQ